MEWVCSHLQIEEVFESGADVSRAVVPYTLSGDYCGSYLGKANANVLVDTFKWLETFYMGFYSEQVGIILEVKQIYKRHKWDSIVEPFDLDSIPDEEWEEFVEMVKGLEDYPLLDEDEHSQIEWDATEEGFDSWADSDFAHYLDEDDREWYEGLKREERFRVFSEAAERVNEYWFEDGSCNMWIRVEEVAKGFERDAA